MQNPEDMRTTLTNLLEIGGSVINWTLDHFPVIGIFLLVVFATGWLTWLVVNWLHELNKKFLQIDYRFVQIDNRFVQIDQRFERLELRQDEFDKRLWRVEKRL